MSIDQWFLLGALLIGILSPLASLIIKWGIDDKFQETHKALGKLYEWKDEQSGLCSAHLVAQESLKGQIYGNNGVLEEKLKDIIRRLEQNEGVLKRIEIIVERRQKD